MEARHQEEIIELTEIAPFSNIEDGEDLCDPASFDAVLTRYYAEEN